MRRAMAVVALCAAVTACGGVDQQKFDGVYKAGQALQSSDVQSGGTLAAQPRERLRQLEIEINALHDRTVGTREADALQAYEKAADAYRFFFRFRALDAETGDRQILLKGPDLEAATRFKLPVDSRNGGKWVNRAQAITILLQAGEQHLANGNRLVHGR